MYPTPINEIEEIRDHFNGKIYHFAKEMAECLLTIPTHHLLSRRDKEKICESFNLNQVEVKTKVEY
jgi:hypothetical protein